MNKLDRYVKRGMAFLEGDDAAKDYEQAYYWLSCARDLGSDVAASTLREMQKMSLGVPYARERAESEGDAIVRSETSSSPDSRQDEEAQTSYDAGHHDSHQSHGPNPNRCIACGVEALKPSMSAPGAKHCSPAMGGCGTTQMIPIEEYNLDRGLAIQPYRENIAGYSGASYSSLGALVHMVKYDKRVDDRLREDMLAEIACRIRDCGVIEQLVGEATRNLVVVPAPSSKKRKVQPVHLLAQLISKRGYAFDKALVKQSSVESKNRPSGTELEPGDIRCISDLSRRVVLLVDDTYGEGATLRACIRALREKGARELYYLSLCKNIFGGMKGSSSDGDYIH